MKLIFLIITVFSLPCAATTCGLYQVEDFGDRVLYSITQFPTASNRGHQTLYTITNPTAEMVGNMVRGVCYCVSGQVQPDPEFDEDDNFKLLTVDSIDGPAFTGCLPDVRGSR